MTREYFESIINKCLACEDNPTIILDATNLIAESKNPYYICSFAEKVNSVDTFENMQILEDAIIATCDLVHIYEFMFLMTDINMQNFNLSRFEDIIAYSGNPKFMFYSLELVEGINKSKMIKKLCATKCKKYIEKALEHFEGTEYGEELRTAFEQSKQECYIPSSLRPYSKFTISQLKAYIIILRNSYLITELAEYLADLGENTSDLQELIPVSEPLYNYEFAASVANANQTLAKHKIIESDEPKYIYYMHRRIDSSLSDKEKLENALKNNGDEKYNKKLEKDLGFQILIT